MLHVAQLPKGLWAEALMHAIWIKNWMSTKALDKSTPYQALTGCKPDLTATREWGQKAWVHDPANSKLDGRAREARWVGFDIDSAAHQMYQPTAGKVSVEHNMKFEPDRVLTSAPPTLTDTYPASPAAPMTHTPMSIADPVPADLLTGLEGGETTPFKGHGARAKWPSAYTR